MGRNVEIKARARDFLEQMALAASIADQGPFLLKQTDTFFVTRQQRLKLREFADGSGELIHYDRPDQTAAKISRYTIVPTPDPAALKRILAAELGVRTVVRKHRTLFLVGSTRIHFDKVDRLGQFIELEVVLGADQSHADGKAISDQLCQHLQIDGGELIGEAYVDLLDPRRSEKGG